MKMNIRWISDYEIIGGIYNRNKYHESLSADEYLGYLRLKRGAKSNLNHHSTRARLEHRIERKFKLQNRELVNRNY